MMWPAIKIKPVKFIIWAMLLLAAVCLKVGVIQADEQLTIGFSRSITGGLNENDALAVIKVWAIELLASENYVVDVQTKIYGDPGEIHTALKRNHVDFICFTTNEFFEFDDLLDKEKFVIPIYYGGSMSEEYLLVVRRNSPFSKLNDLKGRSLIFSKKAVLSVIWLDVELARAGLPVATSYFDRMEQVGKVSDVLLPVFFGKEDACLVTQKVFDLIAELNPQISQRLKILAASKQVIPGILAFRKNYQSKLKDVILNRIEGWNQTPSGNQILTIFQTDALVPKPPDILLPTMELIKEHRRRFGADTQPLGAEFKSKDATP